MDQLWNNADLTLKMKQKSNVGFLTLHNVETTLVSDVEGTLKQRWYNFILKLIRLGLNVSKSYIKTNQASDMCGIINI